MTPAEYRTERQRRHLTQAQLAVIVGVRQGTISDRETARIEITTEAALAIRSLPASTPQSLNPSRLTASIESERPRLCQYHVPLADFGPRRI